MKDEASECLRLEGMNVQMLSEGSPFAGRYTPDDWTAYIEFDICHSLPVLAGPASATGNYVGVHPAVLASNHRGLVHKQTNLHHLVKFYDPKRIQKDRIMGVVVDTHYPPEPEGGWEIPEDAANAVPIRVCAAVFKQAEGALTMIEEHITGKKKWSVSVEYICRLSDMGVYVPSTREILSLSDERVSAAVSRNKKGRLIIGKVAGEQLAFAYGGVDGKLGFQGVGYTPRPAEKEAEITGVHLSLDDSAMEFLSADHLMGDAVSKRWAGAVVERMEVDGTVRLPGVIGFGVAASVDDPVLVIRLASGRRMMKRASQCVLN